MSKSSLDIIALRGNVVIRDWEGDDLRVSHTLTPDKARCFADKLREYANEAEGQMPR